MNASRNCIPMLTADRNQAKAKQQALKYFPGIKDSELPRYVLKTGRVGRSQPALAHVPGIRSQ